ncbi:MAG: hypothetical protein KAI91_06275 [Candidatus Omnitrophica bacterium]|nr:hypothetical protein [Candidatus Omnitrophota bacterium]
MLRKFFIIAIIMTLWNFSYINNAYSAVKSVKSGKVYLKESKGFDDDLFMISIGEKIKADCKFYIKKVFGNKAVWAGADVRNIASKNMYYMYYVAFFDKDMNLIGCSSAESISGGLKPGEWNQLAGCLVFLPSSEFSKIKYYQIILYESGKEIGKD